MGFDQIRHGWIIAVHVKWWMQIFIINLRFSLLLYFDVFNKTSRHTFICLYCQISKPGLLYTIHLSSFKGESSLVNVFIACQANKWFMNVLHKCRQRFNPSSRYTYQGILITKIKLDMSTARRRLKSPRSLSGTSAHPTMVTQVNVMVMNGWLTCFRSLLIGRPIPGIKLFQSLTLKLQSQGYWCGKRARSYNRPSIILTHFLFISHQSDQQFRRWSYFEIWHWNIQGQGHEWGQRSRSYIVPSIQPMHFLFVSHQSDQPFLRYGQNSVWPWKITSEIFNENLPK